MHLLIEIPSMLDRSAIHSWKFLLEFPSSSSSQPQFSQQRFWKRIYIQTIMGLIIPKGSNNPASKLSKLRLVNFISHALSTSFLKLNLIQSFSQSHESPKTFWHLLLTSAPVLSVTLANVSSSSFRALVALLSFHYSRSIRCDLSTPCHWASTFVV